MTSSTFQSVTKVIHQRWREVGQRFACVLLSAVVIIGGLTASCSAQDRPRNGPSPDRYLSDRSLGPILHEARKQVFSSRLDFMALLSHTDIRFAIGLSDDEFTALADSNRDLFDEIKQHFQDRPGHQAGDQQVGDQQVGEIGTRDSVQQSTLERPSLERQQLVSKIVELVRKSDQRFVEQLRDSVDYDRFLQILIQARGNRAVVHEDVAILIGLSPEKLDEVRAVSHKVWREQWESMGDRMRELIRREENHGPLAQGKKLEVRQLLERAERVVDEAIGQRLSSQQREELAQRRGEPFAMPDDLFELRFLGPPARRGPKGEVRGDKPDQPRF